ncbi:unnamed protein product [marine sediment metagenome]|uniref:Uncharacterized protein n=1 Tax=marine sediment metagenome TaxID=412755 RepID=X1VIQ4_9ZZZZ
MEELEMLMNEDLISHDEWQAWLRPQIRLVHKHGDDLARVHIDSAGRQHCFWVWGDVPIIARRLASHPELREEFYGRKLMPEGRMLKKGGGIA